MAIIQKNADFFGFTTDIYVRVSEFIVSETGSDAEGKFYKVKALLSWYTDSTKSHQFTQTDVSFEKLRAGQLNLESIYLMIMSDDRFKEFEPA